MIDDADDLRRFVQQCWVIYCDIELERENKIVDVLFDTHDVRCALLGMDAFYNVDGVLDRRLFDDRRTLVQSLAAAGWLGAVSMLPPHQSETANADHDEFWRRRHARTNRPRRGLLARLGHLPKAGALQSVRLPDAFK